MQNKDSFCAAGPVDVCNSSGNTAGCPTLRVRLVQLPGSVVGGVDKLVLWILLRAGQMTVTLLKSPSVACHVPVMRKHVRL